MLQVKILVLGSDSSLARVCSESLMVNLVAFLSGLENFYGLTTYYLLHKLVAQESCLLPILKDRPEEFIQLCTFPEGPVHEDLNQELTRQLFLLAIAVFNGLGLRYSQDHEFLKAPGHELFSPSADYKLVAAATRVGMELARSLALARLPLFALSFYNYLRNRLEFCGSKYASLSVKSSERVLPAILQHYNPDGQTYRERYPSNDPHGLFPELVAPLGPEVLETFAANTEKKGKIVRVLCLHGIQKSIPKNDVEAKQLCYLSGFQELRARRCK